MAALSSLLLLILGIVTITKIESALFGFLCVGVIWVVEVPFFFGCCCAETLEKLKCLEASKENPKGCVFRTVLYCGLSAAGGAISIAVNKGNVIMLLCFVLLGVDGLCYLGAFFQGVGTTSNATFAAAAKRAAKKKAVDYARENPDVMADFAKDAAQYAVENPDVAKSVVRGAMDNNDIEANDSVGAAWDAME